MWRNILVITGAIIAILAVSYNWAVQENFVQTITFFLILLSLATAVIFSRLTDKAGYIAGCIALLAILFSATGLFVYINGSVNHYILRQPQPVKIIVTYKGDFVKTLRCSQPTWIIPFYYQVKEFPLSALKSEEYHYKIVLGDPADPRKYYLTYDHQRIELTVELDYFITIENAQEVYEEFGTTDQERINLEIANSFDAYLPEVIRQFTLDELIKEGCYRHSICASIRRHIADMPLYNFYGERAHGNLLNIVIPITDKPIIDDDI